jgi:hypothetical protein
MSKKITARWNKNLTITLYVDGRAVCKRIRVWAGESPTDAISGFCEGWFKTADRSKWNIRWIYA